MHLPLPLILPLLSPRTTQTIPDYETYAPCAETCLVNLGLSTSESCTYTTQVAWVTCVCNSDKEQSDFAQCIYTSCGAETLTASAPIHIHNCQINGSPATLSEAQFIADGEAAGTGTGTGSSLSSTAMASTATAAGAETSAIASSTSSVLPAVQQISTSTSTLKVSASASLTSTSLASGSSTSATTAIPNNAPTPTQASSSTPTPSSTNENGSNSAGSGSTLNTASLIGTIIASLTGAVGSCVGAWFAWKKYRDGKKEKSNGGRDGSSSGVPLREVD